MFVDCDLHAGVRQYTDLFPHMTLDWRKHFEREEWIGSSILGSNHIRVSEQYVHPEPAPFAAPEEGLALVIPHQGLTVNGWADRVAARTFLAALNSYGEEHWATPTSKLAVLISPHDTEWSAAEIRRRAATGTAAGVALPLVPEMLGSRGWDPIYAACVETGLPLVVHYSGVEGRYLGAPALSGGVHTTAFARLTLMPHLAESNIASLTFEGAFVRHPQLRVLFTGFGFTWLPSLLWRIDREWRTFRHDIPWVTTPPSEQVAAHMWFSTYPLAEAASTAEWEPGLTEAHRSRIAFGSHAPFGHDTPADAVRVLGPEWAQRLMDNGAAVLGAGVAV
jgi:predicted TIM-barrel fold metal-dependent hydrolase